MKHEWRKKEKQIYIPKTKPQYVDIPAFKYFTISGAGNPNDPTFQDYIKVLYSLSYALKMSPRRDRHFPGFYDYTVYPLTGIWDISDEAKTRFTGQINKDDLVFDLMIRQPDFTTIKIAEEIIDWVSKKKPQSLLSEVNFETICDGPSVQMLHLGSFDNEPATFEIMEAFAEENNLNRLSKVHREIYLSDHRRVSEDKLKTVLRFGVSTK